MKNMIMALVIALFGISNLSVADESAPSANTGGAPVTSPATPAEGATSGEAVKSEMKPEAAKPAKRKGKRSKKNKVEGEAAPQPQ